MNWLHYLLEANLYLGIFYLAYCLFLNKETYYTLNRVYLLLTCIISFALPLMQVGLLKPAEPQIINVVLLPPANFTVAQNQMQPVATLHHFTLQDALLYAYLLGATVFLMVLLFKVYQLVKLARTNNTPNSKYKLIYLDDSNTAFSFFNYLFIGSKADGAEIIIQHELVHIRQKHSADILFIEILKIINWFNPFIYLLQRSLKALHEYIADEKTAALENDALGYSSFLLSHAYGLSGTSITHSFFNYNLLKKRIIMLHQKRSGSLARLKYLLAVPLFGGMLCASTLAFSKNYGFVDLLPQKADTPQVALLPPSPPPSAIKHFKAAPPTAHVNPTYTKKGYRYEEDAYLIKGKTDFRVIIVEKNGAQKSYFKSKATKADLELLDEKYGYAFPVMEIYTKMPPPPPVDPGAKPNLNRRPPPPPALPASNGKKAAIFEIKLLPPVKPDTIAKPGKTYSLSIVAQNSGFDDLRVYLSRNIKYPAEAINGKIVGFVVASLDVKDNSIKKIDIANVGLNNDCNNAVIKAIMNYTGTIKATSGTYKLMIEFLVISKDMQVVAAPDINKHPEISNFDPKTFVGITQVAGIIN